MAPRRKYDREFELQAVQLSEQDGGSVTDETENPPATLRLEGTIRHDEMLIGEIKRVGAQREVQ